MLIKSLTELVVRVVFVATLLGAGWLLLQFFTEEELLQAARDFWAWWSTLLSGELAEYWNPVGAGIALGAIVLFVLHPVRRLFRTRRYSSRSDYYDSGSFSDHGGDGGSDD